VSTPELSVVCKSCGAEVSPYVTECPYCGTRIRKRAPKLERKGDELSAREPRRRRMRKRLPSLSVAADRPYATALLILGPAVLLLVARASDNPLIDFGAIVGPVGDEWWRYLASPFVYDDIGYLFVVGVAVALFGSALEQRIGSIATLLLAVACGGLGMLAADAIETAVASESHVLIAAGGNGIALGLLGAWAMVRRAEVRAYADEDVEVIGAAIAAVVLIALPLVEDSANVFAGLAGGMVGGLAGLVAGLGVKRANQE
jgi:membrane associated rhomboid family serine protease/DNA-directed RNA polymerase subunit RPC12/RpoP